MSTPNVTKCFIMSQNVTCFIMQNLGLNWISDRGITYTNAFGSVSSCSPSRSSILTGMPSHQNGMYGLHNGYHAFNAFPSVRALPNLLSPNKVFTGMCGKKNIGSNETFLFDFEQSEETGLSVTQIGRNITRMNICVQDFLHQLPKGSDFMLYIGPFAAHSGYPLVFTPVEQRRRGYQ